MMPDFQKFAEKMNVQFNDINLLKRACTHRSYLNENKGAGLEHNERLEFLGDAVLELAITSYLFHKFPDRKEGDLTAYRSALVNTNSLSRVAIVLGINDYMLLSRGEAKDTGRARSIILADAIEAIIGALYLDQGYEASVDFIEKHLLKVIDKNNNIQYIEIPTIPKKGQRIEDIGRYKRKDLQPAKNLRVIFDDMRNHLAGNVTGFTRDEPIAEQIINLLFCKIYDEINTDLENEVTFRVGINENKDEVKKRTVDLFEKKIILQY